MIELYINNKKVDLESSIDFSFTYESINTQQPDAIKNTFSKTISLKGTSNNNDIFNHYYKLDRFGNDVFDAKKRIPFELLNNGEMVESGYLSLDSINYKQGQIIYNVTLYGGLGDFFYTLAYNEEGEEKKISDLYFGFSDGNASTDEPISKANETDRRVLFDLNKEYLTESWNRIISQRNTDDYLGKTKKSVGLQDNIVPIPTYSGFYEDFDSNKALLDVNYISDETNTNIINNGLDNSHAFNDRWYVAESTRDIDEWEARDFRANKQRLGIKTSVILDAISNPDNNGGYNVEWDDKIKLTSYYKDSYVMIPRITKNDIIEIGGRKIPFNINFLSEFKSGTYDTIINAYKPQIPLSASRYTPLTTLTDIPTDLKTLNVNFTFYPQIHNNNISLVYNIAQQYYGKDVVEKTASLNTFFSFEQRNVKSLEGYEKYYYNGADTHGGAYMGNRLEEVPLMIYGGIVYKFAAIVNYKDGSEETFYSGNDVYVNNDINKRFTNAQDFFVNSKYTQGNGNRIAVGYKLEEEMDDDIANIMLSHICEYGGYTAGYNLNNTNLHHGEFDMEDNSLLQQGIIKSKGDVFITFPIDIKGEVESIEIRGYSDYVNSGECTRYMNVRTQVSEGADENIDVIPTEFISGYWKDAIPKKNGQYYAKDKVKTWKDFDTRSLTNYISLDYWNDTNRYERLVPMIAFDIMDINNDTIADKTNISDGVISNYFDVVNVTKKMLFNTLPSPYRFLLDYVKLLNYRVEKDPYTKTIYIKENNSYFIDEIINVDESIDYSKDVKILPTNINTKYIEFSVNVPETYASKLYKSKYDKDFNVLKFDTLYEHNNETNKLFEDTEITTTLPYKQSSILNNEKGAILPFLLSPTVTIKSEKEDGDSIEKVTYGYSSYERLETVTDKYFKMCCFDGDNKEVSQLTDTLVFFNYGVPVKVNTVVTNPINEMFRFNGKECYLQGEVNNIAQPLILLHSGDTKYMYYYDASFIIKRKVYTEPTYKDWIYKVYDLNDYSRFRLQFGTSYYIYEEGDVLKVKSNLSSDEGWFTYDKYGYLKYGDRYVEYDVVTNELKCAEEIGVLNQIQYGDKFDLVFENFAERDYIEAVFQYPLFLPFKLYRANTASDKLYVESQFYFKTLDDGYMGVKIEDMFFSNPENLYTDKWEDEFNVLYNKNSITVECSSLIDGKPNELLKKKFFFNNCLWRLIKIEDWSINQQRPFKCTFVRL